MQHRLQQLALVLGILLEFPALLLEYKLEKRSILDYHVRALDANSVSVDMTECLVVLRMFELMISAICSCRYGGVGVAFHACSISDPDGLLCDVEPFASALW